ncbi:MAG: hypothetical protein J7J67_02880 [Thermoproteales archaeon]|nr:hypothetical protein [Thermoproteales archaeon]
MEHRYVLAGSNAIIVSAVFIAFAALNGDTTILGVSIATLILGIVLLSIGSTYEEPIKDVLKPYVKDLTLFVNTVFEDSGIIKNLHTTVCLQGGEALIIFSEKSLPCRNLRAGLGIVNDAAYIGIPSKYLFNQREAADALKKPPDLEDTLRFDLVEKYSLCRDLELSLDNDIIRLKLLSLTSAASEYLTSPLNPVKIAALLSVAKNLQKPIELVREEIAGNNYILEMRGGRREHTR